MDPTEFELHRKLMLREELAYQQMLVAMEQRRELRRVAVAIDKFAPKCDGLHQTLRPFWFPRA